MFYSTYLPVNIGRKNEYVYSDTECYPVEYLKLAKEALTSNTSCNGRVVISNGIVSFIDRDDFCWSIPNVYLAWEAYDCAVRNNFSFYTVCNQKGIPQLFISKEFKRTRILVSAFTFKSIIVRSTKLIRKIAGMIDHKYSNLFCMNLFDVINKVEHGSNRFLEALIIERDTIDQSMIVNPMLTLYSETTVDYSGELIEEMRQIINGETDRTESLHRENHTIVRHDLSYWPPMSEEHCRDIIALYDKMLLKKNNYIVLNGDDCEPYLYVSTNWRYLVNAATLECIVIKNSYLKKLLQYYASCDTTPVSALNTCWALAMTE